MEITDSNQRGGGRRIMWVKKGKGCQGTCVKDLWTKIMGGRIVLNVVGGGG